MATYLWSSLSDGDIIDFNPAVDVLRFDNPSISAAQVTGFSYFDPFFLLSGFVITDWYQGVLLLFINDQRVFTQTNITFADGSVLLNGDNTVGTVNDDGSNTLVGGSGNDQLAGYGGADSLVGGVGDDLLNGGAGNDTLIGGPGNDQFFDDGGSNQLLGGDGADFFAVVDYSGLTGTGTITGGAGRDEYLPIFATNGFFVAPAPIVLDFQSGAGGDLLNFGALLAEAVYSGYYFFQNLFDPNYGFFQFFQDGADTLLAYDPDTPLFSYSPYYWPVIRLKNVTVSSITVDNISQFTPGSDSADNLVGSDTRDFLFGGGGNDTLNGASGTDTMEGGDGSDTYYVDNPKDVVTEKTTGSNAAVAAIGGSDAPFPRTVDAALLEGVIDTVIASISYSLQNIADVENITLTSASQGGAGEFAQGNVLANAITGNELNNSLTGLAGNDTIDGGAGTDKAVYNSNRAAYSITKTASGHTVSGPEGNDTLSNIERLKFSDQSLAVDMGVSEAGGKTALLLGACLGANGLSNQATVGAILGYFDGGYTLTDAATALVDAGIVAQLAGGADNKHFVDWMALNLVDALPDASTEAVLIDFITSGQFTQATFLATLAAHQINQDHIGLTGLQQSGMEYV